MRVAVWLEKLFGEKSNKYRFRCIPVHGEKSKRKMPRKIRLPKNHTHSVHTNVSVGFSTRIIRTVKLKSYARVRLPSPLHRTDIFYFSFFQSIFYTNIIDVGVFITRCTYVYGTASRTYNTIRFYKQYGVEIDGMMGRRMIDENNSLPDWKLVARGTAADFFSDLRARTSCTPTYARVRSNYHPAYSSLINTERLCVILFIVRFVYALYDIHVCMLLYRCVTDNYFWKSDPDNNRTP